MKESKYVSYIKDKYLSKNPNGVFYKIPDAFGVDGKTRPYDFYTLNKGVFTAVEAKIHNDLSPFYFSAIKPHQIYNLRKVAENGGMAYVLIGFRVRTNAKFRKEHNYDYAWVKADVWIPASCVPGKVGDIELVAIDIDKIVNEVEEFKGNKINEIYLSEGRVNALARDYIVNSNKVRAVNSDGLDTSVSGGE